MSQVSRSLVSVLLCTSVLFLAGTANADGDAKAGPTHKQLRTIKPKHGDQDLTLLTFCLGKSRELWLSVSTNPRYVQPNGAPQTDTFQGLQVYDADGQLKAEYPLKFDATAINFAPDGTLFAAGQGKLARISATGEVQVEAPTPNISDMEEFKKKVVEQTKAEHKKYAEQFRKQAAIYAKQIEATESKKQEDRSEQERAQLEILKQQNKQFEQMAEQYANPKIDPESTVLARLAIPGIAVTADQVFVVLQSTSGRGYEVWRTNHDLSDGKMVLDGLLGCCGNMDVQARDDGFVACENSRFQVVSYNGDGKRLAGFGKRDRTSPEGFGSCCNPMNCLSLANGEYIVAESSIGNIKRFDAEGKFLGLVGKARISGSCKHVSLGFDDQRDRYYMMNQDKNHVCVLVPLAEAPAVTEEERLAAEAKAGLGQKLVGHWRLDKSTPKTPARTGIAALLLGSGRGQNSDIDAEFLANGSAKISGGFFEALQASDLSWECERQVDGKLYVGIYLDGVEFLTALVTFPDDDHARFLNTPYFPTDKTFVRTTGEAATPPTEKTAAESKETAVDPPLADDEQK